MMYLLYDGIPYMMYERSLVRYVEEFDFRFCRSDRDQIFFGID